LIHCICSAALVVEGHHALCRPRQVGDDEADPRIKLVWMPLDFRYLSARLLPALRLIAEAPAQFGNRYVADTPVLKIDASRWSVPARFSSSCLKPELTVIKRQQVEHLLIVGSSGAATPKESSRLQSRPWLQCNPLKLPLTMLASWPSFDHLGPNRR
jgi:hypothetical protein